MSTKFRTDHLNDLVIKYASRNISGLNQNQTVGDALAFLKTQNIADEIVYIYIVNEDERLVGVLPLRRLLSSGTETKLSDIMINGAVSIPKNASVLNACTIFLEHRFLALPIVDDDGKIEGVIDITLFTDEVNAFARKSEQDNVFQLIGIHLEHGRKFSPAKSFQERFPWLMFNIVSGLICAFIVGRYELLISQIAMLAMFITIILALAESVSMQSMTITLQALSAKRIYWKYLSRTLYKELLVSACLGFGGGMAVGLTAFIWKRQLMPAVAITLSIFLAVISACLLGILIPAVVRLFRADPKIASGPVVLAISDIVTLIFYFNLANWLIS